MKASEVMAAVKYAVEHVTPDVSVIDEPAFVVISRAVVNEAPPPRSVLVSLSAAPEPRQLARRLMAMGVTVSVLYSSGDAGSGTDLDGAIADDGVLLLRALEALKATGAAAELGDVAEVSVRVDGPLLFDGGLAIDLVATIKFAEG